MPRTKTKFDTLDEYDAELAAVNAERDSLRERAVELTRARDELAVRVEAEETVARMSDETRAALAQAIKVSGVPSSAKAGRVGGDE